MAEGVVGKTPGGRPGTILELAYGRHPNNQCWKEGWEQAAYASQHPVLTWIERYRSRSSIQFLKTFPDIRITSVVHIKNYYHYFFVFM